MADKSNVQRDPDQIRQDIEQTRANMSHTIDALEAKLNPDRLKNEASKTIRRQTVGRAEDFADNASRTLQGASSDVFETIKENPLPAALAAIGLGWLFMESRNENRRNATRTYPMPGRYGPEYRYYSGNERPGQYARSDWQTTDQGQGMGSQVQQKASQVASQAQDKIGQMTDQAQDKIGQMTDQAQDKFGQVTDQAQETFGQWTDAAQQQAHQVKSRLAQTLDENPLLVGAVAVALGAAIGLSLPRTPQEDQIMGPMRDNLMDKAQSTASDTMQKVQQVAQEAGSAAKDAAQNEAQRQNLTK